MCDSKKEDLNLWIEDFLKKRRFSKYELELTGTSSKGDGYLGEVTFVKVLTGIGRDEQKIYNLVIKSAKKSDELRKKTPLKEVFEREMYMYKEVFPAFHRFQLDKGVECPFMKFAKCYSVFNENLREAIILQNLKFLEYDVHDRKIPQNFDHVLHTFKNYGKFHAISLAMKKQRPEFFKQMTQNMTDLLAKFFMQKDMLDGMTECFKEALDSLKNELEDIYRTFLHYDQEVIMQILCKEKYPSDGVSVILHGDCWNNNMMFTYKDKSKEKPSDMMFLDFQLSSLGSPIYDLSYYLYTVADEGVLQYHDLLLQAYHHSLVNYLQDLGETSYRFSLEDVKRHWAEYGKFGLVMAPFIIKLELLSDGDQVMDLAECAEAGEVGKAFNLKIQNGDAYQSRIKGVFKHYASFL